MTLPTPPNPPAPGRRWTLTFTVGLALAALVWSAPAPAQQTPPPVSSFSLDQDAARTGDDTGLTDFFGEAADVAPASATPSLPPVTTTVPPAPATPPIPPAPPAPAEVEMEDYFQLYDEAASQAAPAAPVNQPAGHQPAPAKPAVTKPAAPQAPAAQPAVQQPAAAQVPAPQPLQAPTEEAPSPFRDPLPGEEPAPAPDQQFPDQYTAPVTNSAPALPPGSHSVSVPLGQGALPSPQWETYQDPGVDSSRFVTDAPLPQFDSSQGQWLQLEIGQADAGGRPAPAPAAPRPTSIPSTPQSGLNLAEPEPAPAPASAPAPPPAKPGDTATNAAIDQALAAPAPGQALEPEEREKLRHLFSDMLPPEPLGARAPVTAAPAAPDGGAAAAPAPAASPAPAPATAVQSTVQEPLNLPEDLGAEDEGASAILRAGGLLSAEGRAGAAEILSPGGAAPAKAEPAKPAPGQAEPAKTAPAKPVTPPPAAPSDLDEFELVDEPSTPPAAKPAAQPETKAAAKPVPQPETEIDAQSAPKPKAAPKPAKKKRPAAKSDGGESAVTAGLAIVNETGRSEVGDTYRSVLSRMGYRVVSVTAPKKRRGGAGGQTVITYRPGYYSQAQAVARHLPGEKVLVEGAGGAGAGSQITISIK